MKKDNIHYTELFKKIANNQKIVLNHGMSKHGITYVQSLIVLHLMGIRKQQGEAYEVSQKEIEQYLSLRGSTVTEILRRMEANGYLKREKSAKDSRYNKVTLTQKGIDFLPIFFDVLDNVENTITKGMNEEEKASFLELLQRAAANLEEI